MVALPATAQVVVTFAEDPEATLSTLSGTNVFTFNETSLGVSSNVSWEGVGTFDQIYTKSADAYGGATDLQNPNGTRYSVQGAGTPVITTTLALDEDSSYFGMWWSAGDSKNVLEFYSGDSLVGQFNTANLMEPLPESYDGNPRNRDINSGEPYGFINFLADESTTWDSIVLTNDGRSGFESDNYTSRVEAWDPLVDGALPGVVVATVDGTTTTTATSETLEGTRWSLDETSVGAVPGAPLPPFVFLVAFAGVALLRQAKNSSH